MNNRVVGVLFFHLLLALPVYAGTSSDVLVMRNGDHLTGEIKALNKLSFVDCVAGSLSELRNSTLVTADRDFQKVGRRIRVLWLVRN